MTKLTRATALIKLCLRTLHGHIFFDTLGSKSVSDGSDQTGVETTRQQSTVGHVSPKWHVSVTLVEIVFATYINRLITAFSKAPRNLAKSQLTVGTCYSLIILIYWVSIVIKIYRLLEYRSIWVDSKAWNQSQECSRSQEGRSRIPIILISMLSICQGRRSYDVLRLFRSRRSMLSFLKRTKQHRQQRNRCTTGTVSEKIQSVSINILIIIYIIKYNLRHRWGHELPSTCHPLTRQKRNHPKVR